ncbi:hypothetical protein [Neomegalonema sp.]|uniref:hypothetical protein n=1 Tax=Neomegalonema sp. TaxID=2039713 RepID=UPI00263324D6|nr:hypothetical protein [Neomegalonema sp.]MDD2867050.1 hypothetical protein [Neomegalonema sp.]
MFRIFTLPGAAAVLALPLALSSAASARPPGGSPGDPCWYAPRLIQCSPSFLGRMPVAPVSPVGEMRVPGQPPVFGLQVQHPHARW